MMELKQELKTQNKISQEAVQAVSVLQMTGLELKEYIQEKMLENPVIELEETKEEPKERDFRRKMQWLETGDYQNKIYYRQEAEDSREFSAEKEPSLTEYLMEQLLYMEVEKEILPVLKYMIQSLDEQGYFREEEKETAELLQISPEKIRQAREILCTMEPLGVGAGSLQECLLLQLQKQPDSALACEIVGKYLEEFGKNQLEKIAKGLKKELEKVSAACEQIRQLSPGPARYFPARPYKIYITPDIIVVKLKDYFEILVNDSDSPEIRISSFYQQMLEQESDRKTEEYIREKVRQAQWLKNCVAQRNQTLLQLAQQILQSQMEFFKKGRKYLRPVTQKEAAAEMGVHPSTVSRAVNGKYLQCTWGIFPLSFFFTSGMKQSKEYIKECLKHLIDAEDKAAPYSDRILTEKLQEMDIAISRRTVAKYRESMGISDAAGRKSY